MLYKYHLSESFHQPMKVGFVIRSSLQMRKLRLKGVKPLAQGHRYLSVRGEAEI